MSPKQKNMALVAGFMLFLWLAHQLSFSKTIKLKKQYFNLREETLLFENSSQKLMQLRKENQYYDSLLKSKRISTDRAFQNSLLSTINKFADSTNIKVVSFQNPHVFEQESAKILTYSFTLKGTFNQITRLIYQLEQEYKMGKIISVNYLKKRDYGRRFDYLECSILIQRIES